MFMSLGEDRGELLHACKDKSDMTTLSVPLHWENPNTSRMDILSLESSSNTGPLQTMSTLCGTVSGIIVDCRALFRRVVMKEYQEFGAICLAIKVSTF